MNSVHLDYQALGDALQAGEELRGDGPRGELLKRYRNELAVLLMGLRVAKVIGRNEEPADPAEQCDLCQAAVEPLQAYVDGRVNDGSGMWANMCLNCYSANGSGIGWGVGQLYMHDGRGWQCIGGGNPVPAEDEDA